MGYAKEYIGSGEMGQAARFNAVLKAVSFEGKSVLDVGCACGDLYPFLKAAGCDSYTGLDVNEEYLAIARKRFPTVDSQHLWFECIRAEDYPGRHDIVVAIEVLWTDDVTLDRFRRFVAHCFDACTEALVLTVQSDVWGGFKRSPGFSLSPETLVRICLGLSNKFAILHHKHWGTNQLAVIWR